jgi:hypothetical protein
VGKTRQPLRSTAKRSRSRAAISNKRTGPRAKNSPKQIAKGRPKKAAPLKKAVTPKKAVPLKKAVSKKTNKPRPHQADVSNKTLLAPKKAARAAVPNKRKPLPPPEIPAPVSKKQQAKAAPVTRCLRFNAAAGQCSKCKSFDHHEVHVAHGIFCRHCCPVCTKQILLRA